MYLVLLLQVHMWDSQMNLKDPWGEHKIPFCYRQRISIPQALTVVYVVHWNLFQIHIDIWKEIVQSILKFLLWWSFLLFKYFLRTGIIFASFNVDGKTDWEIPSFRFSKTKSAKLFEFSLINLVAVSVFCVTFFAWKRLISFKTFFIYGCKTERCNRSKTSLIVIMLG